MQFSRQLLSYILLIAGGVFDCLIGYQLLFNQGNSWLFWLHIPSFLIWIVGLTFVYRGNVTQSFKVGRIVFPLSKWNVTGFFLGIAAFPGFVPCIYGLALVLTRLFYLRRAVTTIEAEKTDIHMVAVKLEQTAHLDLEVQPFIDVVRDQDLERKRAAIATLSREARPESVSLLRQMLVDPLFEIRSDASLALTRLEDRYSQELQTALVALNKNPERREKQLAVATCYYEYASSGLLDDINKRFYLVGARDVLLKILRDEETASDAWLQLAFVRQALGEKSEALKDVQVVLRLQPHHPVASRLSMDLAFQLHAWEELSIMIRAGLLDTHAVPEMSPSLQNWLVSDIAGGVSRG